MLNRWITVIFRKVLLVSFSTRLIQFLIFRLSIEKGDSGALSSIRNIEQLQWWGYCLQKFRSSSAQLNQDLWVAYRLKEKRSGFFVDVGACHPTYLSNTYILESKFEWGGLLIEPNSQMVELLLSRRKAKVLHLAAGKEGSIDLLLAQTPEFSTRSKDDKAKNHRLFRGTGDVETVKSQPLARIFLENDIPGDFDYLSVDVEGDELPTLQSNDWDVFRPKLISVEHNFRSDRAEIQNLLLSKGYLLDHLNSKHSWDDWYILPEYLIGHD